MIRSFVKGCFLCLVILSVLPVAYSHAQTNTDMIETIQVTVSPSYGDINELRETTATITPVTLSLMAEERMMLDGTVTNRLEGSVAEEDVGRITAALNENDFFSLPESLDTGVLDGHFTWITIQMTDGSTFKTGGLVAEEYGPQSFINVYQVIEGILDAVEVTPVIPPANEGISLLDFMAGTQPNILRLLDEMPAQATVRHDTVAGGTPKTTTDAALIQKMVEAFTAITVYQKDGWEHSDDYLWYIFTFVDGESVAVEFQSGMLLTQDTSLYVIEGFDALFEIFPPA